MAGLLRELFGGNRPHVPSQVLPTDGWCKVPGVARMSLVWPWYSVPDPQPLVDSYGREVGVSPTLELHGPRSDRDLVLIVWSEPGGGQVIGPEWAASVAHLYAGSKVEVNVPFALGGAVGRMVRIAEAAETTWRIIIPRHDLTVQLEVGVPRGHTDAYWAQLESMLATWGWES